jgi:outer membrane receptor protein involved in Fe transport
MDGGEDQIVTAPGFSDATGTPAPNDVLFDENTLSSEKRTALFGQVSYLFFDKFELILGLRWFDVDIDFVSLKDGLFNGGFTDTARDISESGTTPKVALKFAFDDNKQAYASASKGFRVGSPNFFVPDDACGDDLDAIGFDEAPELIESDSLWQYEVGTKMTSASGRTSINAAVYYTDWTGIPQTIPLNCGFSVSLNVGEASSTGFGLEVWNSPTDGLDLQLAVGYVDAKLEKDAPDVGGEKGDRLQQVPRWTAAASAQYSFPIFGDFEGFVRGDYSYVGDSYISFDFSDPSNRRPEYQIFDFQVGVTADTWEGAFYIDNAFDELAILGINQTDVNEWTVNRPRSVGVRFRKNWN